MPERCGGCGEPLGGIGDIGPPLAPAFARGNLKVRQMLAGHADIGTTANIYARLDTTDLDAALRALNER